MSSRSVDVERDRSPLTMRLNHGSITPLMITNVWALKPLDRAKDDALAGSSLYFSLVRSSP